MIGVRSEAWGVDYSRGGRRVARKKHSIGACGMASAGTGQIAVGEWTSRTEGKRADNELRSDSFVGTARLLCEVPFNASTSNLKRQPVQSSSGGNKITVSR